MSDPRAVLAKVQSRADKAKPGPWRVDSHAHWEKGCRCLSCLFSTVWQTTNGLSCDDIPVTSPSEVDRCEQFGYTYDDAEFIAEARTAVPRLVAALTAVLDEHEEGPDGQHCQECDGTWPCLTVTRITEALEGGSS